MEEKDYERFFELLAMIVEGDGTYNEKKGNLVAAASDEDRTNLNELASWFEGDGVEEGD